MKTSDDGKVLGLSDPRLKQLIHPRSNRSKAFVTIGKPGDTGYIQCVTSMMLHSPAFYIVNNIRDAISEYICSPLPPVPAGVLPNTADDIIDPFTPHRAAIQKKVDEATAKAEETRNTTKQKKNKDVLRDIESMEWYSTDNAATIQYMPQNAADILYDYIIADKKRSSSSKRSRSDDDNRNNSSKRSSTSSGATNIASSNNTSNCNGSIYTNDVLVAASNTNNHTSSA